MPTSHAADDMPLWDGHFLIVGKCSEGKVRNGKKLSLCFFDDKAKLVVILSQCPVKGQNKIESG